jgi:hypothetical protein
MPCPSTHSLFIGIIETQALAHLLPHLLITWFRIGCHRSSLMVSSVVVDSFELLDVKGCNVKSSRVIGDRMMTRSTHHLPMPTLICLDTTSKGNASNATGNSSFA